MFYGSICSLGTNMHSTFRTSQELKCYSRVSHFHTANSLCQSPKVYPDTCLTSSALDNSADAHLQWLNSQRHEDSGLVSIGGTYPY
jgi:hypothetical protein